jgi:hypothetical protein
MGVEADEPPGIGEQCCWTGKVIDVHIREAAELDLCRPFDD